MKSYGKKAAWAGILIGIGMGGFVDGIVLHQILQWHHMLSNIVSTETMEGMRTNMVWDGIFHAFVWIVTMGGIFLLRNAAERREVMRFRPFAGALILGWGLFNFVEGIVNHQILAIHYVRETSNYTLYNLVFLVVAGALLMVIGKMLMRERP